MGKKTDKTFGANPFKSLKGFAVSGAKTETPASNESKKDEPPKEDPPDEELDFLEEMEAIGVRPGQKDSRVGRPAPARRQPTSPAARPKSDEELFLVELGEMDVCFRDEFPSEEEAGDGTGGGQARRMKQLRQGKLVPEAQLDLHGATRHQVHDKLRFFLEDCTYQGYRTVLVVTGRGLHSDGEPVVRQEAERFIRAHGRPWVVEWNKAPRQYGGEGALVLFLRKKNGG